MVLDCEFYSRAIYIIHLFVRIRCLNKDRMRWIIIFLARTMGRPKMWCNWKFRGGKLLIFNSPWAHQLELQELHLQKSTATQTGADNNNDNADLHFRSSISADVREMTKTLQNNKFKCFSLQMNAFIIFCADTQTLRIAMSEKCSKIKLKFFFPLIRINHNLHYSFNR